MFRKIRSGILGLSLAMSLSHCNLQVTDSGRGSDPAMVGKTALAVAASSGFQWSFGETFVGTGKPALVHNVNGGFDYDQLFIVRRAGSRLESFFLAAEGILNGPTAPFGPTNAVGDPAVVANGADGNQLYVAIKTTAGQVALWRITGSVAQISAFGTGLNTSTYGSPSMAYNAQSKHLDIVYREGTRIRHWNGTRHGNGTYTWVNALLPGTGATGTKVVSAVSLAQGADGRLTVVARRSEGDLRIWYTGGSAWPYAWSTGPAFGYPDASTEWPALCSNADGSLQVIARGAQIAGEPELMNFEIRNNVPALLSIFAGSDYTHPIVTSLSRNNLWLATVNNGGSILANGIR